MYTIPLNYISTMMKSAAILALLSASASAFAPSTTQQQSLVTLNAEKSKALPFMNRPALVSLTRLEYS